MPSSQSEKSMSKILRLLRNPLVMIVPVIILLIFVWHQYTGAQSQISASQANILPNGGLDELDSHGFPAGWQLSPASSGVTATTLAGYDSPKLLVITNSSDTPGANTSLTSPLVSVGAGQQYLYKGFYKSTVPFNLILRENRRDGTQKLTIVGEYNSNRQWATDSYLFKPDNTVQTVQFVYSFAAKGELQIDNNYLEADPDHVYQSTQPSLTTNLIPNPSLSSSDAAAPDGWSSFTSGDHQTDASYITDDGAPYLRTQVSNYKNGEAKWQYAPIAVSGDQAFVFQVSYRSDAPVDVIAEYMLSSGQRQFETIATLLPAKDWTTYSGTFEAPGDATSVLASTVLHGNGTTTTKDYAVYNVTKPGASTWHRPMVSITFDDGWQSAYVNGVPALDEYGFKATFYLNPAAIDTSVFMSSDEVSALEKDGHELASHGYEHLDFTTLNKSSIDYQLGHAYQYFKQVHNQQTVNFATPFGGTDSQVTSYARQYYSSLRTTQSGLNTRQNFDPYHLLVLYIGKDTTPAKLTSALAEAKANNGWLILVYHRIDTTTLGDPVISPTQFQQQLDILKKSNLTVLPVAGALGEIDRQL
jgi:peptidoglycan/xylan/chitin deacetylase (PgdA/CDA1 family)